MFIKILRFLFKKIIGNLPEDKKRELWIKFSELLVEITKAAAEGAVKGAKN